MSDLPAKDSTTQNATSPNHQFAPKDAARSKSSPEPRFYFVSDNTLIHMMLRYPYQSLKPLQFRVFKLLSRSMQRNLKNSLYPLEQKIAEFYGGAAFIGELFGQLVDVTLEGNTEYDCLSYTWGTDPWEYAVRLGDSRIAIPQNLYSALSILALEDEDRLVWVDIVCINQDDSEEKRTQVEMMYQIYRGAREVVVDLGYQSDGSENLAVLLEQIRVVVYEECNRDIDLHEGQRTVASLAASGRNRLPSKDDMIWVTFRKFLERAWFTRVWVIQEAIAAKKLTVMCGNWGMKGATFFTILHVVVEWRLPCLPVLSEGQHKWENNAAVGFRQVMLMLHLNICDKDDFPRKIRRVARAKGHRLISLLERSRHARSTDPRDRVFAFLNLCGEEERRSFHPDYTETAAETYTRVARFLVNRGEAPRLLCNAFLSDSSLQLPSWVPDWSLNCLPFENIAPEINLQTNTEEAWPCAGGKIGEFSLDDTCNILQVRAYKVDQISSLGPIHKFCEDPPLVPFDDEPELVTITARKSKCRTTPVVNQDTFDQSTQSLDEEVEERAFSAGFEEAGIAPSTEDELQPLPVLWKYLSEVTAHIMGSTAYVYEEKKNIIWRTMICEREIGTSRRAPPDYYDDWKTYHEVVRMFYVPGPFKQRVKELSWDFHDNQKSETQVKCPEYNKEAARRVASLKHESYKRFCRAADRLCFQLRTGITSTELVGMVPHRTEVGDFAVIIKGVCVPFILRRVVGFEDRFQIVGQAYFYGFMNGEVLQEPGLGFDTIFII